MLNFLVLLCFVQAIVAHPVIRTQTEIEEFRLFLLSTKQDGNTSLEEAMAANPQASAWENSGKYQGDIELFDEEIEEMVAEYAGNDTQGTRIRRAALLKQRHLWPGKTIFYEISKNTFNQAQMNMIHKAAKYFEETTCVRWVQRTNQKDYVKITGRNAGCFATVGYWHGAHTLNLAPACFNLYIIIHEMTHVAGFHHMHQTYNRNDWVKINFKNVVPGMEHNFDIHTRNQVSMLALSYEYTSNMHYGQWAFSKNNQPTIIAKHKHKGQMGQVEYVTRLDVLRLARLYECPGAWKVQVTHNDVDRAYDKKFAQRISDAARKDAGRSSNNNKIN